MNSDSQVAVFIDYDNIVISATDKLGKDTEVEWARILEAAVQVGRVVTRRAYADWSAYGGDAQRELLGLGIELVHVSSKRGKNAADIRIVIDALEMLFSERNNITHVLLVSGDGDFTELVHRLRTRGLFVIGMGVSGTSAEYLVNACDEFIFYDRLAGFTPQPPRAPGSKQKVPREEEVAAPSFDISEARQLLRRVLQARETEWMLAAELKSAMLRLDPAFNERNYGFSSFKEFLNAQKDMVNMRTSNNQLEVQLRDEPQVNGVSAAAPEALLDQYVNILAQNKVRMTPNEYRPVIVFKFFELCKTHPEYTLTQLKEQVHAHFEETAPHVKWQYVHETAHQLFHTYCFDFGDGANAAQDVRLWDRPVKLAEGINKRSDMLDKCDKGLLQKLAKNLGSLDKIDREVAARLLYGSFRGQKMLDHVNDLIVALKKEKEKAG